MAKLSATQQRTSQNPFGLDWTPEVLCVTQRSLLLCVGRGSQGGSSERSVTQGTRRRGTGDVVESKDSTRCAVFYKLLRRWFVPLHAWYSEARATNSKHLWRCSHCLVGGFDWTASTPPLPPKIGASCNMCEALLFQSHDQENVILERSMPVSFRSVVYPSLCRNMDLHSGHQRYLKHLTKKALWPKQSYQKRWQQLLQKIQCMRSQTCFAPVNVFFKLVEPINVNRVAASRRMLLTANYTVNNYFLMKCNKWVSEPLRRVSHQIFL